MMQWPPPIQPKQEPKKEIDKIIESKKASVVDTPSKKEVETDKNKRITGFNDLKSQ